MLLADQTSARPRSARSPLGVLASAALTAVLLTACGQAAPTEPSPSSPVAEAFPRTIEVPAGEATDASSVLLENEPERVAALTYETAELVAALGAADRLVMVPEAATNPVLTNHRDAMQGVETKAPSESTMNAESVIQSAPDLVLLTARHGLEEGVGKALTDAGIPVLVMPNTWATVDDMLMNIGIAGEALGQETEAEALASTIDSGLEEASTEAPSAPPTVLVLSNQAGRPFITAGQAFPLELIRLAGAEDAGTAFGFTKSGPISAEQVIQANPDAVLLIDMNGSDEELFAPIMANPAVAGLPAITEDRVLLVEGRQVQALGLDGVVEGLETIIAGLDAAGLTR